MKTLLAMITVASLYPQVPLGRILEMDGVQWAELGGTIFCSNATYEFHANHSTYSVDICRFENYKTTLVFVTTGFDTSCQAWHNGLPTVCPRSWLYE